MSERGELAIVLHTHMPYVEGFGTWPFGEEWLWDALAGVYLPLLDTLREAPVTLGVTPVLCDQLEALHDGAGSRFLDFMDGMRAQIHAEDARGLDEGGEHALAIEVRRAAGDFSSAAEQFRGIHGDVLGELQRLAADGPLSLWTGTATHAVLPMLATEAGVRLQVANGVHSHERRFGDWAGGFWLPECAYREGLERDLAEYGVSAFCVDQTRGLGLGSLDQLEPIATEAGPVAVPIDWEVVSLVWDPVSGYPTNPAYRDYHGRTVHDLKPWDIGGRPYRHYEALVLARRHAREFVDRVIARLDAYSAERGRPGLCCFALDTELLGHWWYEGMHWLRCVIDEARLRGLDLATLPEALERHEPARRAIEPSTWGRPKDLSTWDHPGVADVTFAQRGAELRAIAAAGGVEAGNPALERAARELLALQASDWAFQLTYELADNYPRERVNGHVQALDAALAALKDSGAAPDPGLRNLSPQLDVSPLFGI